MELQIVADYEAMSQAAARLWLDRLKVAPHLVMALPAGRTPRRLYQLLRAEHARGRVDFSTMHLFAVDELCPPAPPGGYFWRQITNDFLSWSGVPPEQCHPFRVDAEDLELMCAEYEQVIQRLGGLDLVMLGLGPNGHIATNEPGAPFDSRTRPVRLAPETQAYIQSDEVRYGDVSGWAVTLGIGTILEAKEIVLLVSGAGKREALKRAVSGTVSEAVPASVLQRHARCVVIADHAAAAK